MAKWRQGAGNDQGSPGNDDSGGNQHQQGKQTAASHAARGADRNSENSHVADDGRGRAEGDGGWKAGIRIDGITVSTLASILTSNRVKTGLFPLSEWLASRFVIDELGPEAKRVHGLVVICKQALCWEFVAEILHQILHHKVFQSGPILAGHLVNYIRIARTTCRGSMGDAFSDPLVWQLVVMFVVGPVLQNDSNYVHIVCASLVGHEVERIEMFRAVLEIWTHLSKVSSSGLSMTSKMEILAGHRTSTASASAASANPDAYGVITTFLSETLPDDEAEDNVVAAAARLEAFKAKVANKEKWARLFDVLHQALQPIKQRHKPDLATSFLKDSFESINCGSVSCDQDPSARWVSLLTVYAQLKDTVDDEVL